MMCELIETMFPKKTAAKKEMVDNDQYDGEKDKDGHPHGKGVMYYENGDVYNGYLDHGYHHGKGFMHYKNGDV